jgi:hypothetical protein
MHVYQTIYLDIHAIIHGSEHEHNAIFQLDNLQLQYVSKGLQSAVVVIKERNGHSASFLKIRSTAL